jgi:hypothetical protein
MHMKVMKEQFVLDGDKLTHTPTGATFWLGEKDVAACEQGRLNLDTGDDYDLDELKEEAWRIMAAERKARSGDHGLRHLIINVTNSRLDIGKEIRQGVTPAASAFGG